jgi:murein DD-endopeptidase MepM/ murein hydrolase activator NlpD
VLLLTVLLVPVSTSAYAACGVDPPLPPEGFAWPVSGTVSNSWSLDCASDKGHRGIDIDVRAGSPVTASASGTVVFSGFTPAEGGGSTISIEHPGGLRTTYLHLTGVAVISGQKVEQGQVLALTDGSQLHFGLKLTDPRELYFNPLVYLSLPATIETTAASSTDSVTEAVPPPSPNPADLNTPAEISGQSVETIPGAETAKVPAPQNLRPAPANPLEILREPAKPPGEFTRQAGFNPEVIRPVEIGAFPIIGLHGKLPSTAAMTTAGMIENGTVAGRLFFSPWYSLAAAGIVSLVLIAGRSVGKMSGNVLLPSPA